MVDAANFLDTYESFLAIEKQLERPTCSSSTRPTWPRRGTVEQIKEIVEEFNPEPRFYETVYADVEFDGPVPRGERSRAGGHGRSRGLSMTEEELEAYIENLSGDETAEVTPPDRLLSKVVDGRPAPRPSFASGSSRTSQRVVRGPRAWWNSRSGLAVQHGERQVDVGPLPRQRPGGRGASTAWFSSPARRTLKRSNAYSTRRTPDGSDCPIT